MSYFFLQFLQIKNILRVGFLVFLLLVNFSIALAQFNPEINYQGKLTDELGVTVADGDYDMVFRLYVDSSTTTALWTESRTGGDQVTVTNGLFSVMLGAVSSLGAVDFNQTLYLGVTIEADGEMAPRKVLGTVPAAFVAEFANNSLTVGGVASTSLVRNDEAGTVTASTTASMFSFIQNGTGAITRFFAGISEVFTILSNGNIGIASSTPTEKLSVVGNGLFTGTLTASNLTGTSSGSNTGDVTLAGENYLSLSGQQITALAINLAGSNATGTLPVARGGTGITAFGTGVATALGISVGSAGGFVTFNGALGTPSSATLTNATGLPIIGGTTGTLSVARGGTGLTTFGGSNTILYTTAADTLASSSNFTYNGTNLVLAGTTGVSLGGDVLLSRGDTNRLDLATGDSFNLVSGALQIGATTVVDSSRRIFTADGALGAGTLAYSFSGDTNTGIYGTGSDVLRLVTNGADRLSIDSAGNVGIGTTTPTSLLHLQKTAITGSGTAGITKNFNITNSTPSALIFGDNSIATLAPSAATVYVGNLIRVTDNSAYSNTVRGIEVLVERGGNTLGESTALSGFARTFGVRGVTKGDAGGVFEPAGGFFQTQGTAQGNAIRGYSASITSATLFSLLHDTSTFTGTALEMSLGNGFGSFSGKFLDLENAGVSRFTVDSTGATYIDSSLGIGTTSPTSKLTIQNTTATAGIFIKSTAVPADRTYDFDGTSTYTLDDETILQTTSDRFYIGYSEPFEGVYLDLATPASANNETIEVYYYNGSTYARMSAIDGTRDLTRDGLISFSPPSNWAVTTVSTDPTSRYWIYIRVTSGTLPATLETLPQSARIYKGSALAVQPDDFSNPLFSVSNTGRVSIGDLSQSSYSSVPNAQLRIVGNGWMGDYSGGGDSMATLFVESGKGADQGTGLGTGIYNRSTVSNRYERFYTFNNETLIAEGNYEVNPVGFRNYIYSSSTNSNLYAIGMDNVIYAREGAYYGMRNEIFNVADSATGVYSNLTASITGTAYLTGFWSNVTLSASGQEGYGAYFSDGNSAGGGTNFGVYIDIDDPDTTNYSLYVAAGSGVSYFGSSVGIGIDAPSQTLHVAGTMRLTTSVAGADDRTLCTVAATGEIEFKDGACGTSASKYKENIETISYGLDSVRQLNPVFFNYLTESKLHDPLTIYPGQDRTKRRIGFVAEEMQLIAPETVIWSGGEIDGIDYAHLTALLAGGMKDLDATLQELFSTGTTTNTSSYAGFFNKDTVWGKMVALVDSFIDGVLSLTGLNAETVQTQELCIGTTCVNETQLLEMLQTQNHSGSPLPNFSPADEPISEDDIVLVENDDFAPEEGESIEEIEDDTEEEIVDEEGQGDIGLSPEEDIIPPQDQEEGNIL